MVVNDGYINQDTSVELSGPFVDSDKEGDCSSDDYDTPQMKNTWGKYPYFTNSVVSLNIKN